MSQQSRKRKQQRNRKRKHARSASHSPEKPTQFVKTLFDLCAEILIEISNSPRVKAAADKFLSSRGGDMCTWAANLLHDLPLYTWVEIRNSQQVKSVTEKFLYIHGMKISSWPAAPLSTLPASFLFRIFHWQKKFKSSNKALLSKIWVWSVILLFMCLDNLMGVLILPVLNTAAEKLLSFQDVMASTRSHPTLSNLPTEILLQIFTSLNGDGRDFKSMMRTSRQFWELLNSNESLITFSIAQRSPLVMRILLESTAPSTPIHSSLFPDSDGISYSYEWLDASFNRTQKLASLLWKFNILEVSNEDGAFEFDDPAEWPHWMRLLGTTFLAAELISCQGSRAARYEWVKQCPLSLLASASIIGTITDYLMECDIFLVEEGEIEWEDENGGWDLVTIVKEGIFHAGPSVFNEVLKIGEYRNGTEFYNLVKGKMFKGLNFDEVMEAPFGRHLCFEVDDLLVTRCVSEGHSSDNINCFDGVDVTAIGSWMETIKNDHDWAQFMVLQRWSKPLAPIEALRQVHTTNDTDSFMPIMPGAYPVPERSERHYRTVSSTERPAIAVRHVFRSLLWRMIAWFLAVILFDCLAILVM